MSLLFTQCGCLCWPKKNTNSNSTESADERTQLITNPPQIEPTPLLNPPHPPPLQLPSILDPTTTHQHQAAEAEANKILNQTIRSLVNVYSQAPFSHLRIDPTASAGAPDDEGPARQSWRAYDPPSQPSRSHDPQFTPTQATPSAAHQRSFHSLKTIVNHRPGSPGGHCEREASGAAAHREEAAGTPHRSRQSSLAPTCSTQFNTVSSFQTARDDTGSEPGVPAASPPPRPPLQPEFVKHLWCPPPPADDAPDCLSDDPALLAQMVRNGFQLADPGPIVVDL